jgi:excisionase family DNA binding protein
MEPEPAYLTIPHASIVSDLKARLLERAVREGWIRAFRIGRKTLIAKASLDAFIQQHEITPTDRKTAKSELQTLLSRAIEHARKAGA